ncbi:ankyrin repeat containing protein, partial [Trifolium medium]|nr:ankyrin repeat containing protein [Trifolium medium]
MMAAANIASNGIVLEVLTTDNYLDWSALVKNYLIGKKLWHNIVVGNPGSKDENWESKNGQALHTIQLSCGHHTLRQIRNFDTAQEAWNHLKAVFSEDLKADHHDIEQGNSQSDIDRFHLAVKKGLWNDAIFFIKHDGDIISQKSSKGWTSLHVAVAAGQVKIVNELVKMGALLTERDWEGYTPFALAAKCSEDIQIVESMLDNGRDYLLTMKIKADDDKGDIPVLLAAANGHKQMTRFLFSKTPWFTLTNNKCHYGAKLLSHCIHAEIFDVAASLLQHDDTQIPLGYGSDQCMRPIYGLAHIPTAFHTTGRTQLNWCGRIFYH